MISHKLPKYTQAFPDRHGKQRLYFRRPGYPRTALPGPLFSEAFWIAYHKALEGRPEKPSAGEVKTIKGSINDLIARYYASEDFKDCRPATQRNYKSVLEPFRKEYGDGPVAQIRAKDINAILDKEKARSSSSAKNLRKRLVKLFKVAVELDFIERSPMADLKSVKHKMVGFEYWEEDEIAKYREHWKIGTIQRLEFEVLLNTGLRVSDAVRLGPQHFKEGAHIIVTQKTERLVNIPMHPDLLPVLEAIPDKQLTYLATRQGGRARSSQGLTNDIINAAKAAGLPPHRSAHGLRKAICVRLAEAGCDPYEIMAITGHQSLTEVQTYIAGVNKKKLAKSGMLKLVASL